MSVRVGDKVVITDANIDFGWMVGVPAEVVALGEGSGVYVVLEPGVIGRRVIRDADGHETPMRYLVDRVEPICRACLTTWRRTDPVWSVAPSPRSAAWWPTCSHGADASTP